MDLDLEKIIAHDHLPRLDPFGGRAEEGMARTPLSVFTQVTLMREAVPPRDKYKFACHNARGGISQSERSHIRSV
jgi:hypothetical protein